MLFAAWKSLLGRKLRLVLSALSIVLGVAFVAASLMFTNLLSSAFDQIIEGAFGDVNVTADSDSLEELGGTTDNTLDTELMAEIVDVSGVSEATGLVTSSSFFPLDADGNLLSFGGAPGIASNWHTTAAMDGKEGVRLLSGEAPDADDEVVLDPTTVERSGLAVGDEIEVATNSGTETYTIVGEATYGGGATAGASYLFFTLPEMQRLIFDGQEVFNGAWIETKPDADDQQITDDINDLLPEGLIAETGDSLTEEFEEQLALGLSFVNTFLLVFAAIALIVASLLILNTFSILVVQRSKELALFRAMGATRAQVRNSVLFEALVVGAIGATLGLALGYGLAWLILVGIAQSGVDLGNAVPGLSLLSILACYVLAIVVTCLAAWWPARSASKTRPVEAMAQAANPSQRKQSNAAYIGIALLQLGIAGVVCAVFFDVPQPLIWAGFGFAAMLIGCVMAAAWIGSPLIWLLGKLYRALFGEVGRLAELNAKRQPRRTAATAATLMIGLALVSTVAIIASSTIASVRDSVLSNQRGDFLVSPVTFQPFSAEVADQAEEVESVEEVWRYSSTGGAIGDTEVAIMGTTSAGVTEGSTLEVYGGRLNDEGNSVLMSQSLADELNYAMGENFDLVTVTGETVPLLITGIYNEESGGYDLIVNEETFTEIGDPSLVNRLIIKVSDDADLTQVHDELNEIVRDYPTVAVTDYEEYAETQVEQFQAIFGVLYGLLALAVIISLLGILNTLGLSVLERTREIGLLRAVGMTRRQVRRVVRLESVLVTLLGALLGVGLGLIFGIVLVRLLADSGIEQLAVPGGLLFAFVAVAAIFGVLAAIGPARRASRLNVLTAITVE